MASKNFTQVQIQKESMIIGRSMPAGIGIIGDGMFILSLAGPSPGVVVSADAIAGVHLRSVPNRVTRFGIIDDGGLTILGCFVSYSDQPMGQ